MYGRNEKTKHEEEHTDGDKQIDYYTKLAYAIAIKTNSSKCHPQI